MSACMSKRISLRMSIGRVVQTQSLAFISLSNKWRLLA